MHVLSGPRTAQMKHNQRYKKLEAKMQNDEIDSLVQQLKSITNCLYGNVSADADSVYQRLEEVSRLAKLGAKFEVESSKSELKIVAIKSSYCPGCGDDQAQAKYGKCHTHRNG